MPNSSTIGRNIGVKINTAGVISRYILTKRRSRLMISIGKNPYSNNATMCYFMCTACYKSIGTRQMKNKWFNTFNFHVVTKSAPFHTIEVFKIMSINCFTKNLRITNSFQVNIHIRIICYPSSPCKIWYINRIRTIINRPFT